MREKYVKFNIYKINKETLRIANELRKQLPPGTPTCHLKNPDPNLVPSSEEGLKKWIVWKYLELPFEIGLPILKKAFLQQYHIEDEYKLCEYCHETFAYTRDNAKFCSERCRSRFHRHGARKKVEDVTLSTKTTGKQKPENSKIGILSLILLFSVAKHRGGGLKRLSMNQLLFTGGELNDQTKTNV